MTGKIKKSRSWNYIAYALVIVVIGMMAIYFAFNYFRGASENSLGITEYQQEFRSKIEVEGEYVWNWRVYLGITNRGSNNVSGAELVVEIKEDNQTITSASNMFSLPAGWDLTTGVLISMKESEFLGKDCFCVVTIYLGDEVLDQYTTDWK